VDREVTLLAGIARPERFRALVESHGARVVEARFFADHHVFSASDVAAPRAPLLTTEKDATRLPPGTSAWVLRHRLRLVEGESMLREALRVLRRRRNGPREG
jgi:tetraacyldisaccharide 4'-kinase